LAPEEQLEHPIIIKTRAESLSLPGIGSTSHVRNSVQSFHIHHTGSKIRWK
jgi:hypothetical protein